MEYPKWAQESGIKKAKRSARGARSRTAGNQFEAMIDAACEWYKAAGAAVIDKTPEPMRPISKPNRAGQFTACYTKQAQPDYKGTMVNGRAIVFEAKHTDDERITFDRLTVEQRRQLEAYSNMHAIAFVLVSVGLQNFYAVPWNFWRDMKRIYGRKYMNLHDLERFRVPIYKGMVDFLMWTEGETR